MTVYATPGAAPRAGGELPARSVASLEASRVLSRRVDR